MHDAIDADLHGGLNAIAGGVGGKDEELDLWQLLAELADDFEAIEAGHHDIDDDEVGIEFSAGFKAFAAIAGAADQFHARHIFDKTADQFAQDGLIFDNIDFIHGSVNWRVRDRSVKVAIKWGVLWR